jgi:hypothetical protein
MRTFLDTATALSQTVSEKVKVINTMFTKWTAAVKQPFGGWD